MAVATTALDGTTVAPSAVALVLEGTTATADAGISTCAAASEASSTSTTRACCCGIGVAPCHLFGGRTTRRKAPAAGEERGETTHAH